MSSSKRKSRIFLVMMMYNLKKMSMNNNDNDSEVLEKFTHSILKDMKSLVPDMSQLVDEYFWDLV